MAICEIDLNKNQFNFAADRRHRFPAFCGGFGSGKTFALIARALNILFEINQDKTGLNVGYFMPNYPLIKSVAYPNFISFLLQSGFKLGKDFTLNQSDHDLNIFGVGKVLFRSLDNPLRSVIGYELAHSMIDELDRMEKSKAASGFREVVARTRVKNSLGFCSTSVGTTPEGFNFVYDRWQKNKSENYALYKGSTYDNEHNLSSDYIQSILESYPDNLCRAYLYGEFVNLHFKNVYHYFKREINCAEYDGNINDTSTLLVGMDFNVGNMNAVIGIMVDGKLIITNELTGASDTPSLVDLILSTFGTKRKYIIFPDASCGNRVSVDANLTNMTILQKTRNFLVKKQKKNPLIQDRVDLVNNAFQKEKVIITPNCDFLIESLEKQAYDKFKKPQKKDGIDDIIDPFGYLVCSTLPISAPRKTLQSSIRTIIN